MKTIGMTFEEMLENWEITAEYMDDEIRETLHNVGYDTNAEFLEAYLIAHEAKYGEEFVVN